MKPTLKTILYFALVVSIIIFACRKIDIQRIMAVNTKSVSDITLTTATVNGEVVDLGEGMNDYGVYYSTNPNAQGGTKLFLGKPNGTGTFTAQLPSLSKASKYYVRTYGAKNSSYVYGNEVNFTTLDGIINLTTTVASSITATTALCGGNNITDGGSTITIKGVCWSTNPSPSIELSSKTTDGSGTGNFISSLTGLVPNTKYYVRAYAINGEGIAYGIEIVFTTIGLPVITTNEVSSITLNSAKCGGNVTSDGGFSITMRGVCWNTSINPTIDNSKTTDGSGAGVFISQLTNLTPNATYYLRAYATNNIGTSYGNELSFSTKSGYSIGDLYQGGIIFYINGSYPNQQGLVCAAVDQSIGTIWGCYGLYISCSNSIAVGSGEGNTLCIISSCSSLGIAARICYDLELNDYNDWFLPSKDELTLLYSNLKTKGLGNFANVTYWSSSQGGTIGAWSQNFSDGGQYVDYKDGRNFYVRAVRAF